MEALQRKATAQEVKRLSEFQRPGQMVSLHSASTRQQDQAQRGPGQRRARCSFLPGHGRRARAATAVVANAQCCHRYTDNRDRRHEDERPLSLSRPGHGPATARPPTKAKSPIIDCVRKRLAVASASLLVVSIIGLMASWELNDIQDVHVTVGVAHIPAAGDYTIATNGKASAYLSPRLSFGHGSSYEFLTWAFVAPDGASLLTRCWPCCHRRWSAPGASSRRNGRRPCNSWTILLHFMIRVRSAMRSTKPRSANCSTVSRFTADGGSMWRPTRVSTCRFPRWS